MNSWLSKYNDMNTEDYINTRLSDFINKKYGGAEPHKKKGKSPESGDSSESDIKGNSSETGKKKGKKRNTLETISNIKVQLDIISTDYSNIQSSNSELKKTNDELNKTNNELKKKLDNINSLTTN